MTIASPFAGDNAGRRRTRPDVRRCARGGGWLPACRSCALLALALALAVSGCIIPTPLEPAIQSVENHPPHIIAGEPTDFIAGAAYGPALPDDSWIFGVTAADLDVGDKLEARLVQTVDGMLWKYTRDDLAMVQSAADPTRWSARWDHPAGAYCSFPAPKQFVVYGIVTDLGTFPTDLDPSKLDFNDGHHDFKTWFITCP